MGKKIVVCASFICLVFISFTQSTPSQQVSVSLSLNRMDFFGGINYARKYEKLEYVGSLETGINRIIFQSRFFPRIGIGVNYYIYEKERFSAGIQLRTAYSTLNINRETNDRHHWFETYGGYFISTGKHIRFIHSLSLGWMEEFFESSMTGNMQGYSTLGYNLLIGVSYAL